MNKDLADVHDIEDRFDATNANPDKVSSRA